MCRRGKDSAAGSNISAPFTELDNCTAAAMLAPLSFALHLFSYALLLQALKSHVGTQGVGSGPLPSRGSAPVLPVPAAFLPSERLPLRLLRLAPLPLLLPLLPVERRRESKSSRLSSWRSFMKALNSSRLTRLRGEAGCRRAVIRSQGTVHCDGFGATAS